MAAPPEFETIREVADRLRLSPSGVYGLIRRGLFPKPVKLGQRRSGWPKVETDKYLQRCVAERENAA